MHPVLEAIYHVRCDARSIEERARAIAIEQSVEMPVAAIADEFVLDRRGRHFHALLDRDGAGALLDRVCVAAHVIDGFQEGMHATSL